MIRLGIASQAVSAEALTKCSQNDPRHGNLGPKTPKLKENCTEVNRPHTHSSPLTWQHNEAHHQPLEMPFGNA